MSGCDVLRVHEAFQRGDLEGLRGLLGDPPEFPNSPSPSLAIGNFLEYAIYHSPLAFVRTLLELGAAIEYEHSGFPCLIAALSTERADKRDLLELLLAFGADIEQRGVNDLTPLHYAVSRRDLLLDPVGGCGEKWPGCHSRALAPGKTHEGKKVSGARRSGEPPYGYINHHEVPYAVSL